MFGLGLTHAHANSFPGKLVPPPFNAFKYNSDGEKSMFRIKNIERMVKTMYEFKVTMSLSKKMGSLVNFRYGGRGELARGEFACGHVNSLPI